MKRTDDFWKQYAADFTKKPRTSDIDMCKDAYAMVLKDFIVNYEAIPCPDNAKCDGTQSCIECIVDSMMPM